MKKNQICFFAGKSDLESLLRSIESKWQLQFVTAGLFDSPKVTSIESLLTSPDLGRLAVGDFVLAPRFLVVRREISINVEEVPQRRGSVKYAVDQLTNPKAIIVRPGGLFDEKCLISGEVSTASNDADSLELFRAFAQAIRTQFTKVNDYYVGKEAGDLLDNGCRLTANVKSPIIYDLKRD